MQLKWCILLSKLEVERAAERETSAGEQTVFPSYSQPKSCFTVQAASIAAYLRMYVDLVQNDHFSVSLAQILVLTSDTVCIISR